MQVPPNVGRISLLVSFQMKSVLVLKNEVEVNRIANFGLDKYQNA